MLQSVHSDTHYREEEEERERERERAHTLACNDSCRPQTILPAHSFYLVSTLSPLITLSLGRLLLRQKLRILVRIRGFSPRRIHIITSQGWSLLRPPNLAVESRS
jgi:hypothetical protein